MMPSVLTSARKFALFVFFSDHRLGGGDIVVIDQAVAVHVATQNAERDRGRIEEPWLP